VPQKPASVFKPGAPIDETGAIATLDTEYQDALAVHISGGEAAAYALDVSPDNETWFEGAATYSGSAIDAVEHRPEAYVRVRVTTAATTAGTTADVYLAAD
jgi:hypothetical protein